MTNGFVPAATGQAIAFVRNPKEFRVNQYVQNIQSPEPIGLYAVLDPDQPARVVTDQEFAWADGDPRPVGSNNMGNFYWAEFRCFRRDYPYQIGEQAIKAAKGWNPQAFFNGIILQQAMTNRTARVVSLLETVANWGSNTADANTLNGGAGKWDTASNDESKPGFLAIKKALLEAVRRVNLLTNSVVKPNDLVLVISPGLAIAMSETSEIHTYLEKSRFALEQVRGEKQGQNALWGLPDKLYGIELVVEDASRVLSRPNAVGTPVTIASGNRVYCKSDTSAALISRKGGIDGMYGAPSFSTVQCYFYEYELAVEAFTDAKNKRIESHVVEQFKELLAAPAAGFLITNTK